MAIITLNNRSINRSDTASADQVWTATSATASDFQAATTGLTGVTTGSGHVTITNGNLIIGTHGKGIDFTANTTDGAGISNSLLDDYERGTWSPEIDTGGTTGRVISTGYDTGWYYKVGGMVTAGFYIVLDAVGTDTGNMKITGLPFTNAANMYNPSAVCIRMFNITFDEDSHVQAVVYRSADEIVINQLSNTGSTSALTEANLSLVGGYPQFGCVVTYSGG